MTTYLPHTLVTFGGTLNQTAVDKEIWQCGIRVLDAATPAPVPDHQAYLDDLFPPMVDWFSESATAAMFPGVATLNWIKANAIKADGHYRDTVTHVHDYALPVSGPGPQALPDILCLAISWMTAKAVRKGVYASHGRIYPPSFSVAPANASMRVVDTLAAAWAAKGKALLAILAGAGGGTVPVVASGHNAETSPITGVRVGNVLDVQRRRKSALKESYSVVSFP